MKSAIGKIGSVLLLMGAVCFGFYEVVAFSAPISVQIVRQNIEKGGHGWKAGETSVSELDFAEKKMLLGVPISSIESVPSYGKHLDLLEGVLPEEFDWRSINGKDFVSPVKSQGRCGSCVAFSVASTFETQMNIATNSPSLPWSFSPQHLFSCGSGSCKAGWQLAYGMDDLVAKGLPEEACFPYTSGALGNDMECKGSCSDYKTRSIKASLRVRSTPVTGASIEDVKLALMGGPIASTMRVFEDLYFYKAGVYRYTKGSVVGGHAVMIVGWSNANKAWIVRNSWGTEWGMNGDFMIAWDDKGMLGGTFYGVSPAKKFSSVVLEGPRDYSFVNGNIDFYVGGVGTNFASATLELVGASRTQISKQFDSDGKLRLNTAEIADGVYTAQARVKDSSGLERISQAHIFYVRNGEVTASLKIERMSNNMNVWESIVPQFRVQSRPVPVAKIRYNLFDSNGALVYSRSALHTSDLVGISFNPAHVKVGHYVMVGEAVSDSGKVLATDKTEFNVIPK